MQDIIIDIVNRFGYLGIFLLIAIENIFPPIPSEVILTFGGFLTTQTAMNIWGIILASTLGSVMGAVILYLVGRVLNADRLEKLIDSKLGRALHLDKGDVRRAEAWFLNHGNSAVFFCRFVPIVRSLISVPAGMSKMKPLPFLLLTAIGTFVWNTVLVFLGKVAGDAWETIANYVDTYALIALAVLAAGAGIFVIVFIKKRFLKPPYKRKP